MEKVIFYSHIRNLIFKKCPIQCLIINDTVAYKEQGAMRDWTQRPEFASVRALPIADDVAGGIFLMVAILGKILAAFIILRQIR